MNKKEREQLKFKANNLILQLLNDTEETIKTVSESFQHHKVFKGPIMDFKIHKLKNDNTKY